jgi:hypothetical protein
LLRGGERMFADPAAYEGYDTFERVPSPRVTHVRIRKR